MCGCPPPPPPPPPPPTLGYNTQGCLRVHYCLFCNSVYWLKPHNNLNYRPPNLVLLPPLPCRPPSPRGGRGAAAPPNLSIGGASPPPNFRLQYTRVPKSPLLSLFCNSVYWCKPHNNVNSRPPNLAVLPPPLSPAGLFSCASYTVKPLNKGHFRTSHFVLN